MPFVRIDLARGRSAQERKLLGEIVYNAMRATIDVPENDKFQIITEHAPDDLNFAESYLGSQFSDGIVFIQITLNSGRTLERKKALYRRSSMISVRSCRSGLTTCSSISSKRRKRTGLSAAVLPNTPNRPISLRWSPVRRAVYR